MHGIPRGALAQLGERLICIQEVNGSIPLGSTSFLHRKKRQVVQGNPREAKVHAHMTAHPRLYQQAHSVCLLVQSDVFKPRFERLRFFNEPI